MPPDSRTCPFCSSNFSRVDAAKRHARRCPLRNGRAVLERRRGRRPKACDECSRIKVHCSPRVEGVCERCFARELHCTTPHPGRVEIRQVDDLPGHVDFGGPGALSYLLKFTDDDQDFLTESEVGLEPDDAPVGPIAKSAYRECLERGEMMDLLDASVLSLLEPDLGTSPTHLTPTETPTVRNAEDEVSLGSGDDAMFALRLESLTTELASHAASRPDSVLSFDVHAFRQFCTVANARECATTFCRKRHYRYPIIHWPTFRLEATPLPLLLAVILTGAAYSMGNVDGVQCAVDARTFYEIADDYVFAKLEEQSDTATQTEHQVEHSLRLCQAALLMYALDILPTRHSGLQHIATTKRLPLLIIVLRKLGFNSVRHISSNDWQGFILSEQIIRTVAWAFSADCLATLSYNKPPGFSLLEMRGDLPSNTIMWEADGSTHEVAIASPHHGDTETNCVSDLVHQLLNGKLLTSQMSTLPSFHLHIAVCALQQVIYNAHVSLSVDGQSAKLLRALNTWHRLWTESLKELSENDRQKLGVAHHVADLARLSERIVEVAMSPEAASSRYLQRVPSASMRDIHDFIKRFGSS